MKIDKISFVAKNEFFFSRLESREGLKFLSRFLFVCRSVETDFLVFFFFILCYFSLNKILIIQVKIDFVFFVTEGLFLVYFMFIIK